MFSHIYIDTYTRRVLLYVALSPVNSTLSDTFVTVLRYKNYSKKKTHTDIHIQTYVGPHETGAGVHRRRTQRRGERFADADLTQRSVTRPVTSEAVSNHHDRECTRIFWVFRACAPAC